MLSRVTTSIALLLIGVTAAFAAKTPDRISAPLEHTASYRVSGQVRQFALPANDQGLVNAAMPMTGLSIHLQPTDAQRADLTAFLNDLQTPGSANYHKFLTAQQFADRFGASASDLTKISTWLTGYGLQVDAVGKGGTFVRFHGSASQVQSAFQTEIHRYNIKGETHYANSTAPAVPAALGPLVAAIRGLNSVRMRPNARRFTPDLNGGGSLHYLSPEDIGTIYNFAPLAAKGITGTGQKVATVGATDVTLTDLNSFRSQFNLPVATACTTATTPVGCNVQLYSVPGEDPGTDANYTDEANLDLEWSGAMAPNATMVYVAATIIEDAILYVIDNGLAPVVTSSYSEGVPNVCDAADFASDALFHQAIAQYGNALGVTWINAIGDTGAAGCEANGSTIALTGRSATIPGVVPEVTAVGGTEFVEGSGSYWNTTNTANGGSAKSYIPEIAWNDSAVEHLLASTGGGASVIFSKPFWQTGTGVPNDGMRDVPDLSFAASNHHDTYWFCSNGCGGVGGTSVSAPLFAGFVTLLNQYQGALGQGNINPVLYSMAANSPSAFHDVTIGDNSVPCAAGSPDCVNGYFGYSAGVGYDLVTGLGSIDATSMLTNWAGSGNGIATTTALSAATGTVAFNSNLLLTATVKAASGTNTPTGTVTFRVNDVQSFSWTYIGTGTLSGSGGTATAVINFYPGQFLYAGAGFPIIAEYSGDGTFRSSGQTASIAISVPGAKNAAVSPYIFPAAVSPEVADTDGYQYFFQVGLGEYNGVSTTITDLKVDGVSYASQLTTLFGGNVFGGTTLPAFGSLTASIRFKPPTAPYTTVVEVSGKDAGGLSWTQQTPLVITARQLAGNIYLTSDPQPVYGNASNPACPWLQRLSLFETAGRPVFLQDFFYSDSFGNTVSLQSQIQTLFGTMRLAPFGLAQTQICLPANYSTLNWEVDAVDDLGNQLAGTFTSNYKGVPRTAPTLGVSPSTVTLNLAGSNQSGAATQINISMSDSNSPWAIYPYPANRTTSWLTVYPSSGVGSATVTLQANAAGFAPGVYLSEIAVSGGNSNGTNTVPALIQIPVVLTVGQTGTVSISGLQNAASFSQTYAPGMLMAVYGTNLASGTVAASSLPLPNTLSGVSATVNGIAAPLWFISPGQINLQIPYETAAGTAIVGINNNGAVSYQLFQVSPVAPGIFSINGFLNPDVSATAGSSAFLYVTGEGDVSATLATGATPKVGTPLSSLPMPVGTLTVTVGGQNAPIQFVGVVSGNVGLSQVNFQLPAGLTGVQPVVVTVNGVASPAVNITLN